MSSNQIGSKDLTFSFEHSEISEAIAKHQSKLSEFQQKLDSVSADIKALEGYLLANNIAISAKVDVFYHTEVNGKRFEKTAGRFELVEVAMDLPMFKSRRKENKADELKAVVFAESLLWDRDASGKFRLFYQKSQALSSIEIGKDLSDDDQGSYFFKYRKFTQNINLSSPQAGRDYIHVDDVIEALLAMDAAGVQGTVNVAGGKSLSNSELAQVFAEEGWKIEFAGHDAAAERPVCDVTRLIGLGVRPRDARSVLQGILRGPGFFQG